MAPEAIDAFQRAIQLDPQFAMAHLYLANSFYLMDVPTSRQMADRAAQLSERLPRQQKLLIQALQLLLRGCVQEAEGVAQTAVREFPLEIEPRQSLAIIRAFSWKWTEAREVYEGILRLNDRDAYAHGMLAACWAIEGDMPHALASLERYAAFLPADDPNPLVSRGDFLAVNERYEEGIAAYRKFLDLYPTFESGTAFWSSPDKIALSYLHQGKYSLAETVALSNYKKSQRNERARTCEVLGDIEVGRGRLDRAVARYEEAAGIYTGQKMELDRPILFKAAQIYFEQKQPEAALALGFRHGSPAAAGVRGVAHLLLTNGVAAEKDFTDMRISLVPLVGDCRVGTMVEFHRLLAASYAGRSRKVIALWPQVEGYQLRPQCALEVGKACLDAGMASEAEHHLRFANRAQLLWLNSELMPNYLSHTLAHYYLGKLFEQTGRRAEAITAYEEFLAHFENPPTKLPQVVEARATLKTLGAR